MISNHHSAKLLLLLLFFCSNLKLYACTPLSADAAPPWPENLKSLLKVNEVVFVARIDKIEFIESERKRRVNFTVLEKIRGNPSAFDFIQTGPGDGDCSPDLYESKVFLVMTNVQGETNTAWEIKFPPPQGSQAEKDLAFIRSYVAP